MKIQTGMGILLAVIGLGWATERVDGAEKLPEGVFFSESFEDADLAERGWYDGTSFRIVGDAAAEKAASSTSGLTANRASRVRRPSATCSSPRMR